MSPQTWLSGEHRAQLDPEGRILLPMALRNVLNPAREDISLMATLEPEGCIGIRRVDQWDAYVQDLRSKAGQSLRHRRLTMILAATSTPVKIDRQGRLRIPDSLLSKGGIERGEADNKVEVVVAGHFEDLRVWSAPRWETFCEEALRDFGSDLDWLCSGSETEAGAAPV